MKHLAQLNIGRLRHEIGDPRMTEFVDNLARVNAIADRADGFVWRLQYVWQTVHKRFYGKRHEWFETFDGPYFVMWWVPAGHRPTIAEAVDRLEHLRRHGASDYAFGWQDVRAAELFKTARCA